MRVEIEVNGRAVKRVLIRSGLVVSGVTALVALLWVVRPLLLTAPNPVPDTIRSQISYPAIYPKAKAGTAIDKTSFRYQAEEKTLTFAVDYQDTKVVVTEQPAPGDSSNVTLAYYQGLGLRPAAIIQTKQGVVVLVNFYATGSFEEAGQNAVFAKNGTMVIAHPDKKLTPASWKTFFDNIIIDK